MIAVFKLMATCLWLVCLIPVIVLSYAWWQVKVGWKSGEVVASEFNKDTLV